MRYRALRQRLVLWAIAGLLLLKAAVPLLASVAAGLQDKPVAEICSVYGVDLAGGHSAGLAGENQGAAQATPDPGQPSPHGSAQSGDHCALTALTALAAQSLPALQPSAGTQRQATRLQPPPHPVWDAEAAWVAGLKQEPPAQA